MLGLGQEVGLLPRVVPRLHLPPPLQQLAHAVRVAPAQGKREMMQRLAGGHEVAAQQMLKAHQLLNRTLRKAQPRTAA